jgi:hypothetical protein
MPIEFGSEFSGKEDIRAIGCIKVKRISPQSAPSHHNECHALAQKAVTK